MSILFVVLVLFRNYQLWNRNNYQRLHAVISLVNEYLVLLPSVNFDQVIHK